MTTGPARNSKDADRIRDNWLRVVDDVESICASAGRAPKSITILGVTKYVGVAETEALVSAGCMDLGENRPQLLWEKREALASLPIRWHQIGHLQRNKVRRTVEGGLHLVHSVDSLRLGRAVNDSAAEASVTIDCLLEVNISADENKHGIKPNEIDEVIDGVQSFKNIRLRGLMGMASIDRRGEDAAVDFRALRELRDRLADESGIELPELSMGMSQDFPAAIREGSTIVRIGSRLFEGIAR